MEYTFYVDILFYGPISPSGVFSFASPLIFCQSFFIDISPCLNDWIKEYSLSNRKYILLFVFILSVNNHNLYYDLRLVKQLVMSS